VSAIWLSLFVLRTYTIVRNRFFYCSFVAAALLAAVAAAAVAAAAASQRSIAGMMDLEEEIRHLGLGIEKRRWRCGL